MEFNIVLLLGLGLNLKDKVKIDLDSDLSVDLYVEFVGEGVIKENKKLIKNKIFRKKCYYEEFVLNSVFEDLYMEFVGEGLMCGNGDGDEKDFIEEEGFSVNW